MGRSAGRSGCDRHGDNIAFVREYKGLSFPDAAEYVEESHRVQKIDNRDNRDNRRNGDYRHKHGDNHCLPLSGATRNYQTGPLAAPVGVWAERAWEFVATCQGELMEKMPKALNWLRSRTLTDTTLWRTGIGYNPQDRYLDRAAWGLPQDTGNNGKPKKLWLPRGVVIPWIIGSDLWGIRIRRPAGDPKYYWIPGGTMPALYNTDDLTPGRPVVLVEGEIDALTVVQCAGDVIVAVATGSTAGARHAKWITRLELAPVVLVAFDRDKAGEEAAQYWLDLLPNAIRWKPPYGDVNTFAQSEGADVRRWVQMGLDAAPVHLRA
jgi:DNA primase